MICTDALSWRPDYDKGGSDNDCVTLIKPENIQWMSIEYSASSIVESICSHPTLNRALFDANSSSPGWIFKDDIASFYNCIVVPDIPSICERIIKENHDSLFAGHPGWTKMVELVQRNFWWPTVTKDCHKYVDSCQPCQKTKPLHQKPLGLLSPNEIPENFWQIISCDFVMDLPPSKGFNSVMVCVDHLSKMVRLIIPCHKMITSKMAAKKYRDYVWKDFGRPNCIISDQGPQFISSFTRALNSLLGITENFSTACHPQTDGQTEHLNQEMEQYLQIFCSKQQHDWAEWLSCAKFPSTTKSTLPQAILPSSSTTVMTLFAPWPPFASPHWVSHGRTPLPNKWQISPRKPLPLSLSPTLP